MTVGDRRSARRRWRRCGITLGLAVALLLVGAAGAAQAFIYWGNYSTGAIGRAKLDGSGANQVFITGLTNPSDVAVTPDHIYWADGGGIGRANLDGTGVNKTFIAARACSIAVDGTYIYWATAFAGTSIGRARLDGTEVNPSFITGASDPCGVAVDSSHVYWGNSGVGQTTVGRANINGTGVNQSFITGGNRPYDITVDGTYIYWANRGSNTIGRALLNGTGANQAFITSSNDVFGLAHDSTHIFWGNGGVGRAALNGTAVTQRYITTNTTVAGVAVDAVETIRPVTTITSGPPATSDSASATFMFSSSRAGSTFECRLDGSSFAACSSPVQYAQLADGQHTFSVRATDTFGNVESNPPTYSWVVSATPVAPTALPQPQTAPAPTGPQQLMATTALSWDRLRDGRTRLKTLKVENLVGPEVVKLACKGRGCRRSLNRTVRRHGRTVVFTKFVKGVTLRPKAVVTVTVSRPGYVARVITYTMFNHRDPKKATRCLPPGAKRTQRC